MLRRFLVVLLSLFLALMALVGFGAVAASSAAGSGQVQVSAAGASNSSGLVVAKKKKKPKKAKKCKKGKKGKKKNCAKPAAPAPPLRLLSAGAYHSCAVVSGVAKCWGQNDYGALGNGTTSASSAPVSVGGGSGTSGWTAISAGLYHSCGIRAGVALCWGYNSDGQLGNGTTIDSTTPVNVGGGAGTSGWTAISAGAYHSCGIRSGVALCWGYNPDGQLGNGTTSASTTPVNVGGGSGTSGWTAISAGRYHACGVRSGVALCWGDNGDGELGNGTNVASSAPVNVGGGGGTSGWTSVSAGRYHSCGVRSGVALCWGYNSDGQLGNGSNTASSAPVNVGGGGGTSGWTSVSAGYHHACGVRSGAFLCWGDNYYGQLGTGTNATSLVPTPVL